MEIYLDNSATTKCSDRVTDLMVRLLQTDYGNPSSMHRKGMEAEKYIVEAQKKIARILKVSEKEIYFTSGGTESNNLAVLGIADANRRAGNHIITTVVEHPSVWEPVNALKERGFEVTILPVDQNGSICLNDLKQALTKETILVSIMHVNNEVGTVQPIEEAAELIHQCSPKALFHVDAIQSFGKFMIRPQKTGIDLLSVSGHKIHGPKGSGFLYVRDKVKINPIVLGGGQQKGLRSGTENVPSIAGLGEAAAESYENLERHLNHLSDLRELFLKELEDSGLEGITVNGGSEKSAAPHIVSLSVNQVRSEVLLHSLEEKGIYVSAGSACASNKPAISRTLKAIGLNQMGLESTIRFSFGRYNTREDVINTVEALKEIIPFRRKFFRK